MLLLLRHCLLLLLLQLLLLLLLLWNVCHSHDVAITQLLQHVTGGSNIAGQAIAPQAGSTMTAGTGATRHVAAGGAQRAQRLRWWVATLNQSTVAAASVGTQWTAVGGRLASALDWLVIARSTACCQIGQLLCGKDTLRLRIMGEQCMVFQALSCLIALAAMTFVSLTHSVEMVRGKWEMSFEYVQFQLARHCLLTCHPFCVRSSNGIWCHSRSCTASCNLALDTRRVSHFLVCHCCRRQNVYNRNRRLINANQV